MSTPRGPDRADDPEGPDRLDDWIGTARAELGVEPDAEFVKTILNLARVVAHKVDRRGAPVTSYLLGLAVASGQPLSESAARLMDLARNWPEEPEE
jgi:Domain of unknown function (DUF6457)